MIKYNTFSVCLPNTGGAGQKIGDMGATNSNVSGFMVILSSDEIFFFSQSSVGGMSSLLTIKGGLISILIRMGWNLKWTGQWRNGDETSSSCTRDFRLSLMNTTFQT